MTNRYGSANGRGRRISDYEDEAVEKFGKAFRSARILADVGGKGRNPFPTKQTGHTAEELAYVFRNQNKPKLAARAETASRGRSDRIYENGPRFRQISARQSSFTRSGVGKAMSFSPQAVRSASAMRTAGRDAHLVADKARMVRNSRGWLQRVGKSRHYDPESRRQKRLGVAIAATGGVGGALAFRGGRGVLRSTRALSAVRATGVSGKANALEAGKTEMKHLGSSIHARRNDVRDLGLGAAGLGTAGGLQAYSSSRRGRPWT